MNQEELNKILKSHKDWLVGDGGERANLQDAYLRGANLCGADLCGADLCGANLRGANLQDADLCGANLRGANLQDADLRGAYLRGANLCGADLCGANLRGADLGRANLRGANLQDADLRECAGERGFIKSIFVSDVYPITYTKNVLQIGCERYKIEEWWDFDDRRILEMDGSKALKFWREWKDTIKSIIEKSPAK